MIRHWTNKNCQAWAKEYFQTKLTQISAQEETNSVSIKKVSSCDGDVDISQRKGKIITLFDVKLVLDFEGTVFIAFILITQERQRKMKV